MVKAGIQTQVCLVSEPGFLTWCYAVRIMQEARDVKISACLRGAHNLGGFLIIVYCDCVTEECQLILLWRSKVFILEIFTGVAFELGTRD